MRLLLLPILLLSIITTSFCQQQPANTTTYQLSSKILDAATKQALEYVTISLLNSNKKVINGTITNKKGEFVLAKISNGTYTLLIQSLGYVDATQQVVIQNNALNLAIIELRSKSTDLNAVTVTSKRLAIENKLDKTVFNVEKDISSQGGVATDALKKIPGVTVDIDGNVELLGNPSVKFLIDGKPSAIFGNSVADALQSIPNSQIQSIEVITSPSAKYDASGTGGIINIILKKSKIEGFNGNLSMAAGTRLENASLNTSYKKGNFGINAYFSGNAQLTASSPNGLDRLTSTNTQRLLQESTTDVNRNGYKTGLSIDWAFNKTTSMTAAMGFNHFGFKNHGTTNQHSIVYDANGNELSNTASNRNADNSLSVTDFENSMAFRKQFKKEGQELEIAYDGTFGKNTTAYNQQQFYTGISSAFAGAYSTNPGKENEVNLELNYTHPITKSTVLETGFRTTFQSIISNADVFTLNANTGTFSKDNLQSYASNYRRTIYAGYASANFSLSDNIEVKAGARYEYTISKADYSTAHNVAIPNYANLAPSLMIGYKLPNQQSIKLAYSYRIERPDFRDLNPFINLADPHNITTGNPNLQPEVGNQVQLSYNKNYENGGNLNMVAYYQRNSPDIKPFTTYYATYKVGDSTYNDVTLTTRTTISAEVRAGVNISGSLPISSKATIRPNIQLFNRHLNNPYAVPNITDAFGFRVNLNLSYQYSKTLVAEVFGNYNLGMKWQGKQADVYAYTFAFRKQFNNNKASFGFIAVNPFNHYIYQKSQQLTQDFTSNIYRNVPYRSFGITFTYKFGKVKISKVKEPENFNYAPPSEN
ncbi:TonB-dependent receptor domain-containing protein [Parasediminibacterium paludis]|uniref:TonB-dependent receptor domain-containing protein n=1 Tax=Parasediminibacterium paludis TaxID=908966 RepID=A0ABV8PTQ0_9BACT